MKRSIAVVVLLTVVAIGCSESKEEKYIRLRGELTQLSDQTSVLMDKMRSIKERAKARNVAAFKARWNLDPEDVFLPNALDIPERREDASLRALERLLPDEQAEYDPLARQCDQVIAKWEEIRDLMDVMERL